MVLVSDVREHIENENYKNLNLSGILHWITKGFSTSCATLTGAYSCYNYNQNSGLKRFLNNGGGGCHAPNYLINPLSLGNFKQLIGTNKKPKGITYVVLTFLDPRIEDHFQK